MWAETLLLQNVFLAKSAQNCLTALVRTNLGGTWEEVAAVAREKGQD
jgi:hypothetical protein